jgi:CHAT domain-containing protein/tetratricopeptide (TPR) repeat protein
MLSSPMSFRGRAFLGLAALALPLFLAAALPAEPPRSEQTLTLGQETPEQPIKAGEAHPWRLTVPPGTSVLVTVDQRSIGLVAEVRGAGDGKPVVFGTGNYSWGPVVLLLETAGEHSIEVRPRNKSAWPGRYTMRAEAVPSEGAKHDALALMSRAGREVAPGDPDSWRRAIATYRQALDSWQSPQERVWEAEARTCIATLEAQSSDFKTAPADFQAALGLWQELGSPQRQAEIWNWMATLYSETQPAQSGKAWESALALWHGLGEGIEEAQIQKNLCLLDRRSGSLTEALDCYKRSAVFFHEHGLPFQEADSLNFIGGIYDDQGEPDQALAFYQQALDIWRPLGDTESQAVVLNNIGKVHRTLGEWQEALRFYEQSLEALGMLGNPPTKARILNNIGNVYNISGEPQRALGYLEEALKLAQDSGLKVLEIAILNNLGTAWRGLGRAEKALDYHQRALKKATSLSDVQQQATSRVRKAEAYLARKNPSAALRELDEAFPISRENADARSRIQALQLRGQALTLAGKPHKALPVLQEALTRRQKLRDPVGQAETLDAMALAERSAGLAANSLSHSKAAVDLVEELRSSFLSSEDLRASFLATRRRSFLLLIDLLMARNAAEPGKGYDLEAFKVSERSRARSLLDVLRAGSVGQSAAPSELLERRHSLLYQLSTKVNKKWQASSTKAEALENEIDEIVTKLDLVEAKIRGSDPRFAAFSKPQPVSPQEISGGLEPGTMLLEYSLGEERSFLWAIEPGRVLSFPLPRQAVIEPLARQAYKEMSTVESGSAHQGEALQELSRILLGPVWADRAARKAPPLQRLVVVPDGALALLPFAALPVPSTGRSPESSGPLLLERVEVVSIPSATTIAVQRQRPRDGAPTQWAAVFGDPVYTADDPRVARRTAVDRSRPAKSKGKTQVVEPARRGGNGRTLSLSLPRLQATRREAEAIRALAPNGKVRLDLGLNATREAVLKGNLRDFRILHFATHAVADTENPELSGLVLSQRDAEGRPREGFLSLSDIYNLDLDADLVVLSGCRTALGKEVRGEGLIGLTRGFQYAGAPRVVATLWPVEDRSTAELMSHFYQAMWRDHLAPAAALREAQKWLRRNTLYANPHSWAGFVFQGDWRWQRVR